MKHTVESIAKLIVEREGGYVNDPDDPGGPTKFGVTIHTARRLKLDLDRDGDVDSSDVKLLTRKQAEDIFIKHYYYRPKINLLPADLQSSVFDMYVNSGGNAIKILQHLCRTYGSATTVDGALGPDTAKCVAEAFETADGTFVDAYGIARRNYYYALGDRKTKLRKYCRTRAGGKGGWIHRAEEFMAPRFHYTDVDHTRRISAWA